VSPHFSSAFRRKALFSSVDSQPRGFAARVTPLRVPALLLTFSLLALGQLALFGSGVLDWLFPQRDYIFVPYAGQHAIAVRSYILSFYVAFALYASGAPKARLLLAIDLICSFLVICGLLDLGNTVFVALVAEPYPLTVVQIIAGLIGFALFSLLLLERGTMPEPVTVSMGRQPSLLPVLRLMAACVIAATISTFVGLSEAPLVEGLRRVTLLGGIGPGVLLFLPALFLQLFVMGVVERRLQAKKGFAQPVSIIVPAFNEQYIIGETIRHIDRAAGYYGHPVELIVLDNNSTDDTNELAQRCIDEAEYLTGRVILVKQSGKAHALNRGIEEASNPITIRIDADTLVGEDNIALAVENLADPNVGVVGGVPMPPGGAMFDRARLVEVLVKHGYYSSCLAGIRGLVGVPGMFAVYRTEALKRIGSFAHGMNGEDTDMSLRIGELGLHSVVDRRVHYTSEVPATFVHMREQRLRWFRSVYHVSSRGRGVIMTPSFNICGKLVLPYMLLNSARRAMMVPILLFGFFQLITDMSPGTPLVWQAIIAVLVGAPALVAVFAALINGKPAALLALPEYLAFRAMRAWFTLESMLTIPINEKRRTLSDLEFVRSRSEA
jgi:cellulose synthase/poly-beta-1,6-N-acetylglucosamine synthase-like glycosyltransferase